MNANYELPWKLSFSYARALQREPMTIWGNRAGECAGRASRALSPRQDERAGVARACGRRTWRAKRSSA